MAKIALALGGNIGDTAQYMAQAQALLAAGGVEIERVSAFYVTEPVDCPPGTPEFVNAALIAVWHDSPEALLALCQRVERELGRPAEHGVNQARTIDVDIILFDDLEVKKSNLTIPHPRAGEREFVLVPLAEIAPDWAAKLRCHAHRD